MNPYIVAANQLGSLSLEEAPSPTSGSALKEKKRKLAGDDTGLSDAKRNKVDDNAASFSLADAQAKAEEDAEAERLLPGYIVELQQWRDDMPVVKTESLLPLNWHFKPLVEVLQRCPALFELWIEAAASGDQLFEPTSKSAFGYLLPHDFVGMPIHAVTEEHPRFEDLIDRGIFDGRIITRDVQDDFWIRYRSESRQKVQGWLNTLLATYNDDSPSSPRTSPSLPVASVAPTQEYGGGGVNQGGEQVGLNIIPDDFPSLPLSRVLTLIPRLREVLERAGIGGLGFYVTREGRGAFQLISTDRVTRGLALDCERVRLRSQA
ncbi:uncharacterized protein PG986_000951 [Apiospora aurea]|uniref:Uncharacterized protein n=1 Tax=Apiospora aurea TaxID=335848 RepID=A0ABR1QVN8_9PEZI